LAADVFKCRNGCGVDVRWQQPYAAGTRPVELDGSEHDCPNFVPGGGGRSGGGGGGGGGGASVEAIKTAMREVMDEYGMTRVAPAEDKSKDEQSDLPF